MTAYVNFAGAPINLGAPATVASLSASWIGQVLDGTSGNDVLGDIAGGATLAGGAGDDNYIIVDWRTQIVEQAAGGIDTVTAYDNYVMPANVEIMKLGNVGKTGVANDAADTMFITGSHDTLDAGAGPDVLVDSGTGGANIFSFAAGDGDDVLYGFKAGDAATHDTLRLADYGITSFSQLEGKISQVGADTLVNLSNTDAVLLKGVAASSLTANDFMLQIDTSHLTPTFDDEFNGLSLYNPSTGAGVWKTNYWFGAQSGPWAYNSREADAGDQSLAVDPSFGGTGAAPLGLDPFSIGNGVLSINTQKTPSADVSALSGFNYTTGILTTENSFSQTYGYFEIKTELPSQQGMWPAFWLLPKNSGNPPELDVMEYNGGDQTLQTAHTSTGGGGETGFSTYSPGATTGFHTYGVLWTQQTLTWYMDGVAIHTTATPADMNQPMYMLVTDGLSTEINGGAAANFNGASMLVDYVHAYSLADVDAAGGVSGLTGATAAPQGQGQAQSTPAQSTPAQSTPATGAAQDGGGGDDVPTANTDPVTVHGPNGDDSIMGGGGADNLSGAAGADTVHGGGGADTVLGGRGDDQVFGDAGNDLVNGNRGDDTVHGGQGADTVNGGQGDDVVYGDNGNDVLSGDLGNDTLYGGAGADRFVFGHGQGRDVVEDFNSAEGDRIQLPHGASYTIVAQGANTEIDLRGGDTITLLGVTPAHLGDWLVQG